MAREISTIQQGMIDTVQADDTLSAELTSTSKTARWRLTTYVVAVAIYLLEVLFDKHTSETDSKLALQQAHGLNWYAQKAKLFQYGYSLVDDSDYYETTDEDAQIVSHAAVDEINGTLYMKVAKTEDESLTYLDGDQLTSFKKYIARIKDAGVKIEIVSDEGDDLRLVIDIYYDPQVLNADGTLILDSSQEPAKDTIKAFITSLPFNGEFVPAHMVDALQLTAGILIPEILSVETKYADNDYLSVQGKVVPNAGYLTIADENLTINYKPNV